MKKNGIIKILLGSVVNVFEWYDYILYISLSSIITSLFIPPQISAKGLSLIYFFGVFAVGYLSRPLGSLFFGYLSEKKNDSFSLSVSFLVMAISVVFMGMLPTYESIGALALILLMLCRFFQGFALGGSFGSSISVIVESAPTNRKGFFGSFAMMSLAVGVILGNAVGIFMMHIFSEQQMIDFWWRVPFLTSLLAIYAVYQVKYKYLKEDFSRKKEGSKSSFKKNLSVSKKKILQSFLVLASDGVPFYILCIFIPTYLSSSREGWSSVDASKFGIVLIFTYGIFALFGGFLADKFGTTKVMKMALVAKMATSVFVLHCMEGASLMQSLMLLPIAVSCVGIFHGVLPYFLVNFFEGYSGSAGISVSYNLAMLIFGGITPALSALILLYYSLNVLSIYICAICLISLIAIISIERQD